MNSTLVRALTPPPSGNLAASLILGAPWLYLFSRTLPHSAALRSFDLVWLLGVAAWLVARRGLTFDRRSPILLALAAFIGTLLGSAALGVDPTGSFDALRKEILPGLLAGAVLICYGDARKVGLVVASASISGLALRAGLILPEWQLIPLPNRSEANWVKGYAMDAVLAMPLLLGTILIVRRAWLRNFLVVLAMLEFWILLVYDSRTALMAVLFSALTAPIILGRWRAVLAIIFVVVVAAGTAVAWKPELKDRYMAVFEAQSYQGPTAMSLRAPIWHGVSQLIEVRPWLGYGPGWKKMASVAREGGYLERWRAGGELDQLTADYFDQDGGTVNPHNLPLQILFEAGRIGLVAFVSVWGAFAYCAWRAWYRRREAWEFAWLATAGGAFLVAYVVMSISNGLWPLPGPVVGLLAVAELTRRAGGARVSSAR